MLFHRHFQVHPKIICADDDVCFHLDRWNLQGKTDDNNQKFLFCVGVCGTSQGADVGQAGLVDAVFGHHLVQQFAGIDGFPALATLGEGEQLLKFGYQIVVIHSRVKLEVLFKLFRQVTKNFLQQLGKDAFCFTVKDVPVLEARFKTGDGFREDSDGLLAFLVDFDIHGVFTAFDGYVLGSLSPDCPHGLNKSPFPGLYVFHGLLIEFFLLFRFCGFRPCLEDVQASNVGARSRSPQCQTGQAHALGNVVQSGQMAREIRIQNGGGSL
nr:MAG TPA: hypothetical protein [Caudoviricetes sp.]